MNKEAKFYLKDRVNPKSAYLQKYRKNVQTHLGEDGIIEKIMEIIGIKNKWCVEFGAWDGVALSNTWNLINNSDWHGILIEGDESKYKGLQETYSNNSNVITINKYIDIDQGENTLDSILSITEIPKDYDLVSIDIDGCDWYVWETIIDYRPRVVVIEINPSIPNHVSFVQLRDMNVNHGSSLRAMIELGKEKGYELVATTECNAFFVINDEYDKFKISDNSIDAMHSLGEFESTLFQLYDGTLVLCGCDHLIWHGMKIAPEDIQVLPKDLRVYKVVDYSWN